MARLNNKSGKVTYPSLPSNVDIKPESGADDLKLDPKIPPHLFTPSKSKVSAARESSQDSLTTYAPNTARRRIAVQDRNSYETIKSDHTVTLPRKKEQSTIASASRSEVEEQKQQAKRPYTDRNYESANRDEMLPVPGCNETARSREGSVMAENEALVEATERFAFDKLERSSSSKQSETAHGSSDEANKTKSSIVQERGTNIGKFKGRNNETKHEPLSPTVTIRRRAKPKKELKGLDV